MAVRALQNEQAAIGEFGELGAFEGWEAKAERVLEAVAKIEKHSLK